jgi:3-oxoacyl-[acyl-carrier protein] reductase
LDLGLKGRVVLVTGAGQGVGRAIGEAFAQEGAHVAFHYNRSAAGAAAGAEAARAMGVKAKAFAVDLQDRPAINAMVAAVEQEFGPIDILVNNAAATGQQFFMESTEADWKPRIAVTVVGLMHVCQSVMAGMIKRKRGSIVTLAGDSGRIGEARLAVTAATRAAAIAFSKSMAREMAKFNIRVNIVSLGLVKTPNFTKHSDPALVERVIKMYPLRRLGETEDVPPLVLMLASERTAWVTGQVVSINGGYSMV